MYFDPLYYWRKTIAGILLFGAIFYALIPAFGMAAHQFLPPHDHLMMGGMMADHHDDASSQQVRAAQADKVLLPSTSGQRLVHPAADASGDLSEATAIGFESAYALFITYDLLTRIAVGLPQAHAVDLIPPVPPPKLLTVSSIEGV